MIKKLTSILVCFILVFHSAGIFAFDDTDGTEYERAVNTLAQLKVVEGYEDKTFRPDDTLSRAEFAAMVVRLVDTSVYTIPETQIFSDVAKKHWAFEYVNTGYAIGYFSGYGDGSFAPDEEISYAEAVKAMVTMLGYRNVAEAQGGYPYGYIKVANSEKLLTGMSFSDKESITRGNVALLIYNCLDKPMLVQSSFGGETEYFEEDSERTILTEGLGCDKFEGVLTANKVTGVSGFEALETDEVIIGNDKFGTGKSGIEDYIGYELVVYASVNSANDEKTVIFFEVNEDAKVITVLPDDIDDSTTLRSFAYLENDKLKTASLAYDVQVICNSKAEPLFTLEDITPESGSVTLIDNNGDSRIDFVHVKEYFHYVVSMVDADNLEIYDEYGKDPIKLNEKGKTVEYKLLRNGASVKFKNISVGSVLSVLKSRDGQYYEINLVTSPVRGKIDAVESGDTYIIGEASYKRSTDLPDSEVIELGLEGTFYLDIDGNIIRVQAVTATDGNYGYLMAAKTSSGLEQGLSLKVLTAKGVVTGFEVNDKVKVNGDVKTYAQVLDILGGESSITKQPIKYSLNAAGEIAAIEFAEMAYEKAERLYRTSTRMFGYSGTNGSFLINDESTVMFRVPEGGGGEDEAYTVVTNSGMGNRKKYSVEAYDIDGLTAQCVVIYAADTGANFTIDATVNACIVKEVRKTVDEDGVACTKLVFLESGKESQILVNTDAQVLQVNMREEDPVTDYYKLTEIEQTSLKKGDVFYYITDAVGNASTVARVFPQDPSADIASQPQFIVSRGVSAEKAIGRPKLVADGGMLLDVAGSEYLYSLSKISGTIYAYYCKSEELKVVKAADVLDIENAGEAGAPYIYLRANTGIVGDVFLFYPNK